MENTADVEYYTTYPKTPGKKWRETPTSGCAWAHPSIPSGSRDLGSLPVAMILVLLYYYYSKKKARETERKKYGKKVRGKNTGVTVRGETRACAEHTSGNRKKGGKPGCACAHPRVPLLSLPVALSVIRNGQIHNHDPPPEMWLENLHFLSWYTHFKKSGGVKLAL